VVELDQLKFWLSQRPSVSYTHAAKYGYLHYFDGEKVETRMVEREFAERLVAELSKEEGAAR
jgi:hypothetical protein